MKSIIAVINGVEENKSLLASAVNLATFFGTDIKLVCFLEAPVGWEKLRRAGRDKFPEVKAKIAHAKELMDSYLKDIRNLGIVSSKGFCYYQDQGGKVILDNEHSNLILVQKKSLNIKGIKNTIVGLDENVLVLNEEFNPTDLNLGLFNSSFKTESELTPEILCRFLDQKMFSLNLLYINTKLVNEDSAISIKNMKRVINNCALSKTKISIFYADTLNKGLLSFVEVNETDIIIRELCDKLSLTDLNLNFTPTLYIRRS